MKKLAFISLVSLSLLIMSCSDNSNEALTQDEIDDLKVLREEEKLARDVYLFAYDKYGEETFKNISGSEQKHMDKILDILEEYGIADPASSERGVFNNSELQELYNSLTAKADSSLLNAFIDGAIIEDLDIKDIDKFALRTKNADILDIYAKLRCGSENHIRSYFKRLEENNYSYQVQFISEAEIATILASSNGGCGNRK